MILQGNFAPIHEIGEAMILTSIEGEIPKDFPEGVYIRNGPNPTFKDKTARTSILGDSSSTWFEERLRFGKVNKDFNTTNVFEHAGKVYSIAENHFPYEIDISNLDLDECLGSEWFLGSPPYKSP
ncbi:hypothetical protein AAC387_Pa02g2627 [Persea americana]